MNKGVMVVGDVHGCFDELNTLLSEKRPEIVLACGDFGYWPRVSRKDMCGRNIPAQVPYLEGGKIYFCEGNHEDYRSLIDAPKSGELWPNVFWKRRGETLTLPDGRVVLFCGGAESTDKAFRVEGVSWFPEERIAQAQIESVSSDKVDVVVSHTAPADFLVSPDFVSEDPSRLALSHLFSRVRPKEWYFGHFHMRTLGENNGCRWTALNMLGGGGSWVWLARGSNRNHGRTCGDWIS